MFFNKHLARLVLITFALFGAGTLSVFAQSASTTPSDTTPPSGASIGVMSAAWDRVSLRLYASDNIGVVSYDVFRREGATPTENDLLQNVLVSSGSGAMTDYVDTTMQSGRLYYYAIKARDAAGNISAFSAAPAVAVPASNDTTPPSAPTEFTAQAPTATEVRLMWHASTDNVGVTGYKIFRSGTMLTTVTNLSYTDTVTTAMSGSYVAYSIRAVDAAGNESTSAYVTMTLPSSTTDANSTSTASTTPGTEPTSTADTTPPVAPTAMTATAVSSTQVAISWSGATDNVGVVGYKLFRNGTYYIGVMGTSYTDSNVVPDTVYSYAVKAVDMAGNESLTSTTREVRTPAPSTIATSTNTTPPPATIDTTLPTAPYNFSHTASSTGVTFTFSGASDNVGVVAYKIFRNGVYLKTTAEPRCTDYSLSPSTTYSYYVRAVDAAGNESAPSQTVFATTLAAYMPPSYPTTTVTAAATTTSMVAPLPTSSLVAVTVSRGTSFCDGSIGKTKMTFTANPAGGARFSIVRNGVSTGTIVPGTYDMLNGTYKWEAIANAGFAFDHVARDEFVLNRSCEVIATPPPPPATTETSVPSTTNTTTALPSIQNETPLTAPPVEVSPAPVSAPVTSATDVTTSAQYVSYCDNPDHRVECTAYASAKITIEPTPETPSVSGSAESEADLTKTEDTQILAQRIGVRMFQDSDSDGITDYDEVNIYHTDATKADTNSDGISDGEQLLAGNDPLNPRPIIYEDPKVTGVVKPELLTVTGVAGITEETSSGAGTTTRLAFSGTALPNSFVTLYIFSDPIVVRVRADDTGAWTYVLDRELADGSHEVVSAITDTGGRILAKSTPVPFVKVAAAVSFGSPELIPTQSAPSFFSGKYFYLSIALFIILLLIALAVIGGMVRQKSIFREGEGNGTTL